MLLLGSGFLARSLRASLSSCCRRQVEQVARDSSEFQQALSLLPYDLPAIEPAAELKQKILTAAQRTEYKEDDMEAEENVIPLTQPNASGSSRRMAAQNNPRQKADLWQRNKRGWPTWMMGVSTSVAAVAITAFGITQIQRHQQARQNSAMRQQLEAANTELINLRRQFQSSQEVTAFLGESDTQVRSLIGVEPAETTDTDSSDIPKARLLAQAGNPDIVLLTQDLPQLPPNQIYRLWSVAEGAATPTYCGEFRQDENGTARWRVPDASCTQAPSQLLITLDAPEDPTTSAGQLVLKSEA